MDRKFRLPRAWSNRVLHGIAPLFTGEVVNVSAWDDRDKEGGHYRDYFTGATAYHLTNYSGTRGWQGQENEHFLDLTAELPDELGERFDVVFNHTTLEHVFEVRTAFSNLCRMSRDIVIVVVPFAQEQHETETFKDFWRFTPTCLRALFLENGLQVVFEAENTDRNAGTYILAVGARRPEKWTDLIPAHRPIGASGQWIGERRWRRWARRITPLR